MKISICQAGKGILARYREWLTVVFEAQGYEVDPMPAKGSIGALGDLLFSMNFVPELAKLAARIRKPYVCWFCDPVVNFEVLNPAWASPYTIMFHFSRSDMERFRAAGYAHVFYLPLSIVPASKANQNSRAARYNITFIGNCYAQSRQSPFRSYKQAYLSQSLPPEQGLATLEAFVDWAAKDLSAPLRSQFCPFVKKHQPNFFEVVPVHDRRFLSRGVEHIHRYFVDFLLYHEIDHRVRRDLVRSLAPLGMHVWGDADGWSRISEPGLHVHGVAKADELGPILSESKICVNVTRRITDGVNMRAFEIPAFGGFQLAQHHGDLVELFEPDKEIVCYGTGKEAVEKAQYYLRNDSARSRIAEAGRARYLKDHTFSQRCKSLMGYLKSLGIM